MEYTKGEWGMYQHETELGTEVKIYSVDNSEDIAYVGRVGFRQAEIQANANLIVAAPDMYEALKAMADIHSPYSPRVAHDMADKALAKAEGK